MPLPPSRRSPASPPVHPAPVKSDSDAALEPTAVEPEEVPTIDPNQAEESEAAEAVPASASGRHPASASSRRPVAPSSTVVPAYKSARVLTPEEQAARRQELKFGLKVLLVLLLVIAAAVAGWWFLFQENPQEKKAIAHLHLGEAQHVLVLNAIRDRRPDLARTAVSAGKKAIEIPELGNARDVVDPNDPLLASLALAAKASALRQTFSEEDELITKLERDVKVETNKQKIMDLFGRLNDMTKDEMKDLEMQALNFMSNPVEPGAGPRDDYVTSYQSLVTEVKNAMRSLEQAQARLAADVTTDQEKKCMSEIDPLVKQELYQESLDKISAYAKKYPDAKLDPIKQHVEDSAKQAWDGVKTYVDSKMIDYKAPGTPAPLAAKALGEARTRLQQVIDRFGIETYVSQAKEWLDKLPQPSPSWSCAPALTALRAAVPTALSGPWRDRLRRSAALRAANPRPRSAPQGASGDCCSRALPATPARGLPPLDPHEFWCHRSSSIPAASGSSAPPRALAPGCRRDGDQGGRRAASAPLRSVRCDGKDGPS